MNLPDLRPKNARVRRRVREAIQLAGYDVLRRPFSDPLWRVVRIMESRSVSVVLDVGANDGGFARDIRGLGYRNIIHSFEPVGSVFGRLRHESRKDPSWSVHKYAIGKDAGLVDINVAANAGASSSILPMLEQHSHSAPDATYVATEKVAIETLDRLSPALGIGGGAKVYLKIDVQGYEPSVLEGASRLIATSVEAIQLELSLQPLYGGSLDWRSSIELVEEMGFTLAGVNPGFSDRETGQMLQMDGVFLRTPRRE